MLSLRPAFRSRGEQGETVIETVILFPALVLAIMVIIQFSLWYSSQELVRAAADEGARVARQDQSTAGQGADTASRFVALYAGSLTKNVHVSTERSNTSARVTVDGSLTAIVPFLRLPLHATVNSPLERFYGSGT